MITRGQAAYKPPEAFAPNVRHEGTVPPGCAQCCWVFRDGGWDLKAAHARCPQHGGDPIIFLDEGDGPDLDPGEGSARVPPGLSVWDKAKVPVSPGARAAGQERPAHHGSGQEAAP